MIEQTVVAPPRPVRRGGPFTWLTRTLAFCAKELAEVRRQPRLIASLVGGPFLVLVIFGAGYQRSTPELRTALVLPPEGVKGMDTDQLTKMIGTNFTLVNANADRATAEAQLRTGELDVVQVLPADAIGALQRGETPKIEFLTGTINPVTEGWIQYLAYAEVTEINRTMLTVMMTTAQQQTATYSSQLAEARKSVDAAITSTTPEKLAETRRTVSELNSSTDSLLGDMPPGTSPADPLGQARGDLETLRTQLRETEQVLNSGAPEQQRAQLQRLSGDLERVDRQLTQFRSTPAERIVAPISRNVANLRGAAYSPVVYYAPGVLALLIQHTAVSLGALALVRERLMGALEIFRVSPVRIGQMMIGKYLAYTLIILVVVAALTGLLRLIGVPFLGNWQVFAGLALLLTLASLGVGFFISAISQSDSQAIQLSMIVLLLSIFFSGFFIELTAFAPYVLPVSYVLPLTHGVRGVQDVMLRGVTPPPWVWLGLAAITLVSFATVGTLVRRQFARA